MPVLFRLTLPDFGVLYGKGLRRVKGPPLLVPLQPRLACGLLCLLFPLMWPESPI